MKIFKRKRKQCCNCFKTFYKTESIKHNGMTFDVSPCCEDDYIIV